MFKLNSYTTLPPFSFVLGSNESIEYFKQNLKKEFTVKDINDFGSILLISHFTKVITNIDSLILLYSPCFQGFFERISFIIYV